MLGNVYPQNHTKHIFWAQYRVFNAKPGDKHGDHCGLKRLLMLCNINDGGDATECPTKCAEL